jgi:hypothetical protein
MLNRFEVEEIATKFNELWPSGKPLTDAELEVYQIELKPYSAQEILAALTLAKRKLRKVSRPHPPELLGFCRFLAKERKSQAVADDCAWCRGKRYARANVYLVDEWDAEKYPAAHKRQQVNGRRWLIAPLLAHAKQMVATEVRCDCGHCAYRLSGITIKEFHDRYNPLYEWSSEEEREIAERCLDPVEPIDLSEITFFEFKELARKGMVEIDGRDAIYMDGILKKTVEIFNDD